MCPQRLAEDDNPAIAAAASKTILELKRQWEIGEGDSWRFMVDEVSPGDVGSQDDNNGTYQKVPVTQYCRYLDEGTNRYSSCKKKNSS